MLKKGVYAATLSVLNNDYSLNIEATINHAEQIIAKGLHGVFFFGSTGQSQLISISEKKDLISDDISAVASKISKNKNIRKIVHSFQLNLAYNPPQKYDGSCLDGRDITYKIIPDADFKFFVTANLKTRALRRYKELKVLDKATSYQEVLKSIKKRDKSDYNRRISPLKKTKDSILLNTTKLSKRQCFLKIKKIIDRKINN